MSYIAQTIEKTIQKIMPKKSNVTLYKKENSEEEVAFFQIESHLKKDLLNSFKNSYQMTGKYFQTGGEISSQIIKTLVAGGGAATLSTKFSSSLFLATANPNTLMRIGEGVGSAVMGTKGIVGQAAFIPASTAILPVTLPILVFQAFSAISTLKELNIVNKKLNFINEKMDRILKNQDTTDLGEILSSESKLSTLEEQFTSSHKFSDMMIHQLTILEKISSLLEKYKLLFSGEINIEKKEYYGKLVFYLFCLDLRVEHLKYHYILQEQSDSLELYNKNFLKKITTGKTLLSCIKDQPKKLRERRNKLSKIIDNKDIYDYLREFFGGELEEIRGYREEIQKIEEAILQGVYDVLSQDVHIVLIELENILESKIYPTLVYWKDGEEEHSYYTYDNIL